MIRNRFAITLAGLLSLAAAVHAQTPEEAPHRHAIAMHGLPALPPDFQHFPHANPVAPKGGAFRIAIFGSFDALNSMAIKGNAPPAMVPYIVQPLMMRSQDEPFTLYGLLAETIAVPDDRHFVEFRINPKARFSDGKPVTARDVLFSWTLFTTRGRPNYRSNARKVEKVELRDPMTIRFTFKDTSDRELPLILGLMPVLPEHATDPEKFENMGYTAFVGSGPYVLDSVDPGNRLTLRRRADYWAKDLPVHRGFYNFETVTLDFFRDSNTMFEAFKTGSIDYREEADPAKWREGYDFPAATDGRVVRDPLPIRAPKGMSGFIFNTRRPVFADIRLREAMLHLFDFEWMNARLFAGAYRRTSSYFDESDLSFRGHSISARERQILGEDETSLPASVRDGSWAPPKTDASGRDRAVMRRAIALLAEAGYAIRDGVMVNKANGEKLTFEVLVLTREKERIALAFADQLRQVGIFPTIRLVDSSQYWARLRQFDFDTIIENYPVGASPGQEQLNRWSTRAAEVEGTFNRAGVRSKPVDRALEALLAARSREDFVAAARALDRLLIAGHYVLPLYHASEKWTARWRDIQRPDRLPTYDLVYDTFWKAANR